MATTSLGAGRFGLAAADRARLLRRLETAVRRARRSPAGEVLAAVTVELGREVDPVAVAVASRIHDEPWFCIEQPDRDRAALGTLGCVKALDARGPERFATVARAWRSLARAAECDAPDGLRATGPVAVGGFAFASEGGAAPHWRGFAPASLHVPEVALARRGEEVRLTLGALDKVVLAREVDVLAPAAHDPASILGVLREAFPECFVFCAGRGERAFLAASPELLVRREGLRAGTLALAGSTRRSADPAVDDHLGEQLLRSEKDREEQAIVTRRIVRALRPFSVWITAPDEPIVAKMANIQHLATPIRAH